MAPIFAALLGLAPAIVGTICGWVAIGQIRASAGALRGAGPATFAALFCPAWLFIALAALLCGRVLGSGGAGIAGLFIAIRMAFLGARKLWSFAEGTAESTRPQTLRWPWFVGLALVAGIVLLPVLGLTLPYFWMRRELAPPTRVQVADVVTTQGVPFVGRLPKGSVELLAVSPYPSTGESWGKMDGSPATAPDIEKRTVPCIWWSITPALKRATANSSPVPKGSGLESTRARKTASSSAPSGASPRSSNIVCSSRFPPISIRKSARSFGYRSEDTFLAAAFQDRPELLF